MNYFCRYMKRRCPTVFTSRGAAFILMLMMIAAGTLHSPAQNPSRGPAGNPNARLIYVIDTLNSSVIRLRASYDSLFLEHKSLNARLAAADTQVTRLNARNNQLRTELTDAVSRGMQSSHTSSVLMVFNVIVAMFLVVALVWMWFRRRPVSQREESAGTPSGKVSELSTLDQKLEYIQKLGALRDKGLLTGEEFDLQKKQILGEL